MASLITALSGASTSLPPMINKTSYPPPPTAAGYLVRSGGGCLLREKKPRWIRKGKVTVAVAAVKAMGGEGGGGWGAKFKGTQMREKQLAEMIEKKVMEAKEACEGDERSDECKVAWDEVEEVSQAKADLRLKLLENHDPLESFCRDHPETDECLIYED